MSFDLRAAPEFRFPNGLLSCVENRLIDYRSLVERRWWPVGHFGVSPL